MNHAKNKSRLAKARQAGVVTLPLLSAELTPERNGMYVYTNWFVNAGAFGERTSCI